MLVLFHAVIFRGDSGQSDGNVVSGTILQENSRCGQVQKQRIEEEEELTSICAFDNLHPVV